MKEAVTKFDLESAFKALDEIDIPVADDGIKANRPALTEIFSRKTKFDALLEEYYDISSNDDLEDAQAAREAEVAKAKLARIEKIVDLDADSPEDLLTSYVGKYIIQCPQCMTLFYKNQEDVIESEDDPNTVNVNEVCQHCGNEAGYTLIGKVGEAEAGEFEPEEADIEITDDVLEDSAEEPSEESTDTESEDLSGLDDLEDLDLELDVEDDEAKTEESFIPHGGEALVEELTDDESLDAKLEANDEYIEYLRATIAQEEKNLETADNSQIKAVIQRNIDAFKVDLEAALPEAVKNGTALADESSEDIQKVETSETSNDSEPIESEVPEGPTENVNESLNESLQEGTEELDISDAEFEELMSSPEFKRPISDVEVEEMLNGEESTVEESLTEAIDENTKKTLSNLLGLYADKQDISLEDSGIIRIFTLMNDQVPDKKKGHAEMLDILKKNGYQIKADLYDFNGLINKHMSFIDIMNNPNDSAKNKEIPEAIQIESFDAIMAKLDELHESSLEAQISASLTEAYKNVSGFKLTGCTYSDNKLMVDGVINFKSGNTRQTTYTISEARMDDKHMSLSGLNEKLGRNKKFTLAGKFTNNTFIAESLTYNK